MNRRLTYILLFLSFCMNNVLFAQEYRWIAKAEAGKQIYQTGMDVDAHGNIYVSAKHEKDARLYAPDKSGFVLHKGQENFNYHFIAKYDSTGKISWLQGLNSSHIYDLCTDKDGNVYITGALNYSTEFTSSDGKNKIVKKAGWNDCSGFAAKYNTNGELQWVVENKKIRFYTRIETDEKGNVYVMYPERRINGGLELWVLNKEGKELYTDAWRNCQVEAIEINKNGEIFAVLDLRFSHFDCLIDSVTYQQWKPRTQLLIKYIHKKPLEVIHAAPYEDGNGIFNHTQFNGSQVTNFRYINGIHFDKNQKPVYSVATEFQGYKTIYLGGRIFNSENGNMVLAEMKADGTLIWAKQIPGSYYNYTLTFLQDGRWLWVCPTSADTSVKETKLKVGKYSSQWVQELTYSVLDKKGNEKWRIIGGGTTSAYHHSKALQIAKNKFAVCSDIVDYAVLKGDTIKTEGGYHSGMYIGVIDEKLKPEKQKKDSLPIIALKPLSKNNDGILLPNENAVADTAQNPNTETAISVALNNSTEINQKPERKIEFALYPNPTNGIFKLIITSDKATKIEVVVTDGTGKILFNTFHNILQGQNNIEFDLSAYANGYYFVRILENGKPFTAKVLKQ